MSSPVEQIKSRLSAADLIQSYVKLQKSGANFKAVCPFHSEKTPSFYVSPARDIWHCFGCGRGGDIFGFVMEIEGVEFPEALKILAQRAGVELKREDPKFRNERLKLLEILEAASEFYIQELKNNPSALLYLKKRGLLPKTVSSFKIGFASVPSTGRWQNLYNFLKSRNYADWEIEKTGLIVKDEKNNRYYDRFRNRIMFPLFDSSGRIVGFSGRIFGKEDETTGGKYINTPQTILYDKSRILYGFDKAKNEIRKKDFCILVEGQMDVLMSHQAGYENTAAISGTALTLPQLGLLKRLTNNIIVAFDKDSAGVEAAKKGIDIALNQGFDIKVLTVSSGKDPADLIKENPDQWKKSLDQSVHLIEFYLNTLADSHSDPIILKRRASEKVLPYISLIQNEMEKAHWVSETAKKLKIKEEPVWEELKKAKSPLAQEKSRPCLPAGRPFSPTIKTRRRLLEERIIGLSFWKKTAEFLSGETENLLSEENQSLWQRFKKDLKAGFLTEEEKKMCERLAFEAELYYDQMDLDKEIKLIASELKKEKIKKELENLALRIQELESKGENKEEIEKHLKEFQTISKEL